MFLNDAVSYMSGLMTKSLDYILKNFIVVSITLFLLWITYWIIRSIRTNNNSGEKL